MTRRYALRGSTCLACILLLSGRHGASPVVPDPLQDTRPTSCSHSAQDTIAVPPGRVSFGEDGSAQPGRPLSVGRFRIDRYEVTNRQFSEFVRATGYVSDAERDGAGAVFVAPTTLPRGLDDLSQWWQMVPGASWRHPTGPGSSASERPDFPVVQVTLRDARAYARWKGHELPTDVEWEHAMRFGQQGPVDPMHWAYSQADGHPLANTWQGVFPLHNLEIDGYAGLAPVGCFPPNRVGLYDMIGNVWEWTSSTNGGGTAGIVKGGSYLCARNYCANFRPAGWQAQEFGLPTSHIGFRTISRGTAE